ncbi:MAG: iron-containing alcohol dehydrogenase [Desulfobacteraceae bacterium]|nr:iron-containing alcohol dehydrogenase [Desulfobacteraceae bacterium]
MNTGNFTFLCRTKTGFGMNALEHLPFDLSCMGSQKPLVLLDNNAQLKGCAKPLIRAFKESGMTLGLCPPIDGGTDPNIDLKTLKNFYGIYIDKGFDSIIALGTGKVADMAKALNIAVTLGPDTLKATGEKTQITQPLTPFIYIPTGMGTGMETDKIARLNGKTFNSPFLAPDLAIIDPEILIQDTSDTIINAGLTCLATCCEAHVLSDNPPARAYCATGIGLIIKNFLPLVQSILTPEVTPDKKTTKRYQTNLAQASVITGIILANCKGLLSIQLGRHLAKDSTATPGQAMTILLPAVLDLITANKSDLGNLILPLSGLDEFSSVPISQRPALAIQKIRSLLNKLYQICLGTIPRTLSDTGVDRESIDALVQSLSSDPPPPGTDIKTINLKQAKTILTHALDGQPLNQAYLN